MENCVCQIWIYILYGLFWELLLDNDSIDDGTSSYRCLSVGMECLPIGCRGDTERRGYGVAKNGDAGVDIGDINHVTRSNDVSEIEQSISMLWANMILFWPSKIATQTSA